MRKQVIMSDSVENPASETAAEDPEGLDSTPFPGWGDYPLDSVFVRTEQRTVGEVVRRIRADRYDLNPDFQREFLWPVEKQSRLIESCLMRIPLPVFYVAEAPDGRIIVVDGLQRLTTFKRYLDNEFKLTFPEGSGEDQQENPLSGKLFKDLQLNLQERIEDSQLTLYILDSAAPERAKLDIFERVNSGEPLTRQQMRNCLYNGRATRWLKNAAEDDRFLIATRGSLDRKKMRDREAINRFCAFQILGWTKYPPGDMDGFLGQVLDQMNRSDDGALRELSLLFNRSMVNNFTLFGTHAFRKSLGGKLNERHAVLNIALFDVCSVLLANVEIPSVTNQASTLRQVIKALVAEPKFAHAIGFSTNSRKQVATRFEMMQKAIAEVFS
jgi:Protein of unknown function DUF262